MKKKNLFLLTMLLTVGLTGCQADFMDPIQIQPGSVSVQKEPAQPTSEPSASGENLSDAESDTREPLPITLPDVEALSENQPEPADDEFVLVQDYLPEVWVELAYATADNFTGKQIYQFTDVYLRYGTVKKLARVCEELSKEGLGIKIWDGYRPVSAQQKLWEVFPDPAYVANPNEGFSSHSCGNTVDLTLVDSKGYELEMPTEFDDFSELADRDNSDCGEEAAANAQKLENTMKICGFEGYSGEWWHFTDTDSYSVSETFEPLAISRYYANCNEYLNLRKLPSTSVEAIGKIPAKEQFRVLAYDGDFAYVDYKGMRGYVHRNYIKPVE